MRPIVTDRVAWSGSRSVTLVSLAKTAKPIEMPFGLTTQVGPGNHMLHGVQISMGRDNFRGKGAPIRKYIDFLPWAVQNGLNQSICPPLGCGLEWVEGSTSSIVCARWRHCAQVQSYSPGGANVPSWEGTLAQPGEYDWTVRLPSAMRTYFKLLWPLAWIVKKLTWCWI